MLQFIETLVVGLIVGLLARALKPGDDKMGILMTVVLGVVGSLVAGYIGAPRAGMRRVRAQAGSHRSSARSCCSSSWVRCANAQADLSVVHSDANGRSSHTSGRFPLANRHPGDWTNR